MIISHGILGPIGIPLSKDNEISKNVYEIT